ncbi:MAG: methionine--tRNA ligase, partial [Lutimaribacter sp.]
AAQTILTAMKCDDHSWPDDMQTALGALPVGHAFEVPDVLFAKITDEQREDWQARFAGQRS